MWRVLNYRQIKTFSACIVLILSPETNDGGELKKILIILVLLGVALAASGKAVHTLLPFAADLYLRKAGFCLGYSYKYRQAVWVAYTLTAANLQGPQVRRSNRFRVDPAVKYAPVKPRDYDRTGYDKGHLAPAADMTYSAESMSHTFLMSNISPQMPGCNRGIWKRLETQVRHWAIKEGKLSVVTGPVFTSSPIVMGSEAIPVPAAYYKVILDLTSPMKMIGFIIPNRKSKQPLSSFVHTVAEVERVTGCDFFRELEDDLEERLEKESSLAAWEK